MPDLNITKPDGCTSEVSGGYAEGALIALRRHIGDGNQDMAELSARSLFGADSGVSLQ